MIKEGDTIPFQKFRTRKQINIEMAITYNDTFGEWSEINTDIMCKNKRIVLIGVPGAFTPTCGKAHLPRYEQYYRHVRSLGIDEVYCTGVNDPFVMDQWMKMNAIGNVKLIPDGNGEWAEKIGMLCDMSFWNYGNRSWRYSMVIENCIVEKLFVEPGFPNDQSDPYKESSVEKMLIYLKEAGKESESPPEGQNEWTRGQKFYYGEPKEKHDLEALQNEERREIDEYRRQARNVIIEELGEDKVMEHEKRMYEEHIKHNFIKEPSDE